MFRVIVATSNTHKAEELETMLNLPDYSLETMAEAGLTSDPEEDASTFIGNAQIKARAAFEECRHKGIEACVLADDSGISVDALGGEPGVFSARYAGVGAGQDAINKKLFAKLEGVPFEERVAHFSCALVFIDEVGNEISVEGKVHGRVGFEPIGNDGFGYDPIFYPEDYNFEKTFGEVAAVEKNKISHRARACQRLRDKLLS